VSTTLGRKLGPILFQLPPFFKKDLGCLREFLALVDVRRVAFEFRHESWFAADSYRELSDARVALVSGDPDDERDPLPLIDTTGFGYLRLRASTYSAARLKNWAKRIRAQRWSEVFIYFKHEVQGPAFAQSLIEHLT
jgi:uncharacterized protein YecE (DUF72 family)